MPAARRPAQRAPRTDPPRRPDRARRAQRPAEPEQRARSGSDVFSRVIVAVPAAVLAIVFADFGGTGWTLMMIVLGGACMHELYRMLERWRPVSVVGFAALVGMCLAARFEGLREVIEVAMAAVPVLFVALVLRGHEGRATVSIAATLLGIYWLGSAFAHAVLLRQLPEGKGIVIDVMIGTFLGDTGAYFGGRLFGRRALAPEISPNKTVEGLFCGMFVAILAVFCAGLFQTWLTRGDAFLLGVAIAVLGPIGDLFESLVKRDAGAKDAGSLFGAHGGALDRLDAVSFTIVAAYYIWVALPHPS